MRFGWLAGLTIVVLLGWTGWWWIASTGQKAALEAWLADRRAAGWVAETKTLDVTGYPFRLDAKATGLALSDPEAGWAWDAPEFQILSLAYRPNAFIAVWPGEQRLSVPGETVTLTGEALRGSLSFVPETALTLDTATVEILKLRASSTLGWQTEAEKVILATRPSAEGTAPGIARDVAIDAKSVGLPPDLRALFDRIGLPPEPVGEVKIDATLAFDAPWDRNAVEGRKPLLTGMALREGLILWGDLRLEARGRVTIDGNGHPVGDLAIVARNWRKMLKSAVAGGLMSEDFGSGVETALAALALLSGGGDTIRAPLTFADGLVSLGPVPIGPAPVFPVPQRQ